MIRRLRQWWRNWHHRGSKPEETPVTIPPEKTSPLTIALQDLREHCTECMACTGRCAFLSRYGTPRSISTRFDFTTALHQKIAYECSLCGLCAAICPEKLDPGQLFLEIRRQHVEDKHFSPKPYRALIGYESCGTSPLFSWYGLPQGCDTVFFPGCTFSGTRPTVTLQIYQQLRRFIPSLGMVLDCCTKPSHDLGRTSYFHSVFGEMLALLARHGVHTVLTACPNCTKIFRQYGKGLAVQTIYEVFHAQGLGKTLAGGADSEVSVHDPCVLRDDPAVQTAVRGLLTDMGHTLVELKHHKQFTVCCGEGGAVGCLQPRLAQRWTTLRRQEAGTRQLVACCAGCTGSLNRITPTVHIADLLFRPEAVLNNTLAFARPPFTYFNRIVLKQRMKRIIRAHVQGTRPTRGRD